MNNMLIDLQVSDFLQSWKEFDGGEMWNNDTYFNISEKLSNEEFLAALSKARKLYQT